MIHVTMMIVDRQPGGAMRFEIPQIVVARFHCRLEWLLYAFVQRLLRPEVEPRISG
jgi:hypothetical protein